MKLCLGIRQYFRCACADCTLFISASARARDAMKNQNTKLIASRSQRHYRNTQRKKSVPSPPSTPFLNYNNKIIITNLASFNWAIIMPLKWINTRHAAVHGRVCVRGSCTIPWTKSQTKQSRKNASKRKKAFFLHLRWCGSAFSNYILQNQRRTNARERARRTLHTIVSILDILGWRFMVTSNRV